MIYEMINDNHRRIAEDSTQIDAHTEECFSKLSPELFNALKQNIDEAKRRARLGKIETLRRKKEILKTLDNRRPQNHLVHNLSSKVLTDEQNSVLQKDSGYNVTDAKPVDFVAAVESAMFQTEVPNESKNAIRQQISRLLTCRRPCNILTKTEWTALRDLKKDKDTVILPADKGRATVVLDSEDYNQKMLHLLSDSSAYRRLDTDPMVAQKQKVTKALNRFKSHKKLNDEDLNELRPKDSAMARIYGLPKIHKEGIPLRPIVSLRGTPIFGMAKWLSKKISHINESSLTTVSSSNQFLQKIKNLRIEDHETMVSFDVISLFTSIPQDLAITVIREKLDEDAPYMSNQMDTDDLLELLRYCLKTHFTFGERKYEQIKGTPMGSPISGLIAEAVLQKLEKIAMDKSKPAFWTRYVDDTFAIINKRDKNEFLETLNSVFPDIQFTMEEERNGNLAFLDVLVSRQLDGNLMTSVYRKATNTDRILHHDSNHPVSHKISCIRALFDRIETHCSTPTAKAQERAHLQKVCAQNGYSMSFTRRYSRRGKQRIQNVEPGNWRSLPYINTVSEATARILSGYGVKVAHKPNQTIRCHIMRPKLPLEDKEKSGVVYSIKCNDCECNYVGETARRLGTRMREHEAAIRRNERLSLVYTHSVNNNHTFNFREAKVIAQDSKKAGRLIKEAWFSDKHSINRHIEISPAYQTLRHRAAKGSRSSRHRNPATTVRQDLTDGSMNQEAVSERPLDESQNDRGSTQVASCGTAQTNKSREMEEFRLDRPVYTTDIKGPTTRSRARLATRAEI